MRDEAFVRIGGYLFEAILPVMIAWKFRKHLWVHIVAAFSVTSMLYCLQFQDDFTVNAAGPMLIWWLAGILSYVMLLYISINALLKD